MEGGNTQGNGLDDDDNGDDNEDRDIARECKERDAETDGGHIHQNRTSQARRVLGEVKKKVYHLKGQRQYPCGPACSKKMRS